MPNYNIKCKVCNKEFVAFSSIGDRHDIKCECGGDIKILIKPQRHLGIHIWRPYWEENITFKPQLVESKQHLKELCKKHGVIARRLD